MIVLSIFTFAYESVDQRFGCNYEKALKFLEWFFNVIFTLEMLARCYVSKWSELATDILLFFDVLAIMPFWFGRSTREIPLARCRRYSSSTPASISRTRI